MDEGRRQKKEWKERKGASKGKGANKGEGSRSVSDEIVGIGLGVGVHNKDQTSSCRFRDAVITDRRKGGGSWGCCLDRWNAEGTVGRKSDMITNKHTSQEHLTCPRRGMMSTVRMARIDGKVSPNCPHSSGIETHVESILTVVDAWRGTGGSSMKEFHLLGIGSVLG